ncbi:hypothetical protein [Silvimonas iriomotensis]|nr:hypothetical protein [Silvimonas iriomotensis]
MTDAHEMESQQGPMWLRVLLKMAEWVAFAFLGLAVSWLVHALLTKP